MNSQNATVLNHLRRIGPLTAKAAFTNYDVERLSARIYDLRKKHKIETVMTLGPTKKRVAYYRYVRRLRK